MEVAQIDANWLLALRPVGTDELDTADRPGVRAAIAAFDEADLEGFGPVVRRKLGYCCHVALGLRAAAFYVGPVVKPLRLG
jgi:hypothetical protein